MEEISRYFHIIPGGRIVANPRKHYIAASKNSEKSFYLISLKTTLVTLGNGASF